MNRYNSSLEVLIFNPSFFNAILFISSIFVYLMQVFHHLTFDHFFKHHLWDPLDLIRSYPYDKKDIDDAFSSSQFQIYLLWKEFESLVCILVFSPLVFLFLGFLVPWFSDYVLFNFQFTSADRTDHSHKIMNQKERPEKAS